MPKECLLRIESKNQGGTADFYSSLRLFRSGRFFIFTKLQYGGLRDERENHCFAKRNQ